LQEVGEIMHLAGSGRVIIQLTEKLDEGAILCDETGTKVAKVMELIGPIKRKTVCVSNSINK
jgi:RNA-binding protein